MRILTVLVLAAVAFAGCTDSTPAEPADDIETPEAQATSTTGAISGVVVDVSIVPIAGASVSMDGHETTTDENGGFAFEGLEPATYFVTIEAEGYESAQTSAQVAAGEVAKVRVQLTADVSPVPTASTDKFDAYMEFSDFYVVYILTDIIGPNQLCECKFETAKQENLKTVILEAQWQSSHERVLGHDLYWDVFSDSSDWQSGWDDSPTYFRHAGGSFVEDDPSLFVLVSSDVQPDIQQPIEIFLTQFTGAEAPEGWSLIEASS